MPRAERADAANRVAELEEALRERMAELTLLHEQVAALRADLAVKDAYVEHLQTATGVKQPEAASSLHAAGYKMVDKVADGVRKAPGLAAFLRWVRRVFRRG